MKTFLKWTALIFAGIAVAACFLASVKIFLVSAMAFFAIMIITDFVEDR